MLKDILLILSGTDKMVFNYIGRLQKMIRLLYAILNIAVAIIIFYGAFEMFMYISARYDEYGTVLNDTFFRTFIGVIFGCLFASILTVYNIIVMSSQTKWYLVIARAIVSMIISAVLCIPILLRMYDAQITHTLNKKYSQSVKKSNAVISLEDRIKQMKYSISNKDKRIKDIEYKIDNLEDKVLYTNAQIQRSIGGYDATGKTGCGSICKGLTKMNEEQKGILDNLYKKREHLSDAKEYEKKDLKTMYGMLESQKTKFKKRQNFDFVTKIETLSEVLYKNVFVKFLFLITVAFLSILDFLPIIIKSTDNENSYIETLKRKEELNLKKVRKMAEAIHMKLEQNPYELHNKHLPELYAMLED